MFKMDFHGQIAFFGGHQHANHTAHAGAHPIEAFYGTVCVQSLQQHGHVACVLTKLIASRVL